MNVGIIVMMRWFGLSKPIIEIPHFIGLKSTILLNWCKANRKALNAGKMKLERVEKFKKLPEMTEQYRRKNQYE